MKLIFTVIITYKEIKSIDKKQLLRLFESVGWVSYECKKSAIKDNDCIANDVLYIKKGDKDGVIWKSYKNSTYVISAWDKDKLVGTARVISDIVQRSFLYDLAVLPEYQGQGIGTELAKRCFTKFPKTQFTLGASSRNFGFYEKFGFKMSENYMEREGKGF